MTIWGFLVLASLRSAFVSLEVVLFGVLAAADGALVLLALIDVRICVRAHVLAEVAHLREALAAGRALVRLHALVHAHVIQQVPHDRKRSVAVLEPAAVHFVLLAVGVLVHFDLVLVVLEDLQALGLFVALGVSLLIFAITALLVAARVL